MQCHIHSSRAFSIRIIIMLIFLFFSLSLKTDWSDNDLRIIQLNQNLPKLQLGFDFEWFLFLQFKFGKYHLINCSFRRKFSDSNIQHITHHNDQIQTTIDDHIRIHTTHSNTHTHMHTKYTEVSSAVWNDNDNFVVNIFFVLRFLIHTIQNLINLSVSEQ